MFSSHHASLASMPSCDTSTVTKQMSEGGIRARQALLVSRRWNRHFKDDAAPKSYTRQALWLWHTPEHNVPENRPAHQYRRTAVFTTSLRSARDRAHTQPCGVFLPWNTDKLYCATPTRHLINPDTKIPCEHHGNPGNPLRPVHNPVYSDGVEAPHKRLHEP